MPRIMSTGGAGALALASFICTPALAWKPTTHVYLAERAMEDALDGTITLKSMNYHLAPNGAEPSLGDYPADPIIVQALNAHPRAFRAGVLGPDAYPDLFTGQSVIHPTDEHSGSDAWLRYIYEEARATQDLEIIAFAVGFLAHAAGDMYGHTYVNEFAGGPFELDHGNAERHMTVEGYIGKKTPPPLEWNASISANVHQFIYRTMVDVTEGTHARSLYAAKGTDGALTIPWLFSSLRDALASFAQSYRAERDYLASQASGGPLLERPFWAAALAGYVATVGPLVLYTNAWINDIDRGLRAWPDFSSQVAIPMMFTPNTMCDAGDAGDILNEYWRDHMKSMLGVPDVFVSISNFVDDVVDAVIPFNPFDELQEVVLDYVVRKATGKTPSEWCEFLVDPERSIVAATQLVPTGRAGLDADLHLDTTGRFRWQLFPAASNTVTMIKLAFLGEPGLRSALTTLGHPAPVIDTLLAQSGDNAMLGFIRSLDEGNQWATNADVMMMHADCSVYQDLFVRQLGEPNADISAPSDHYEIVKAGSGVVETCDPVSAVTLSPLVDYPTTPYYCGPGATAEVTIAGSVGPLGGRVRLVGDGLLKSPAYAWVPAGANRTQVYVDVEPTLSADVGHLTATRQNTARVGSLAVGPASVNSLRLREDFWEQGWQRRYIVDGEAITAGRRLTAEITTDCDNIVDGTPIVVRACPTSGGACVELARATPREALTLDLTLPAPANDGEYTVSAAYDGRGVQMRLFLVSTRVAQVTFDPLEVLLSALDTTPVVAHVELTGPARDGGERIRLEYFRGLTGPASVVVPQGTRSVRVPVLAPRSAVQPCEGSIGVISALSELDAVRAPPAVRPPPRSLNPANPRAQLGYLGMEFAGSRSTTQCLDWRGVIDTNMKLEMMLELLRLPLDREDPRPVYPQEIIEVPDGR